MWANLLQKPHGDVHRILLARVQRIPPRLELIGECHVPRHRNIPPTAYAIKRIPTCLRGSCGRERGGGMAGLASLESEEGARRLQSNGR